MQMSQNPIQILSDCFGQAMWDLFSDIKYQISAYENDDSEEQFDNRRPDTRDIEVMSMFAQEWNSTFLGFSGLGSEERTIAYTIVLGCSVTEEACVFFGGKFAYKVCKPNDIFLEDLSNREMKSIQDCHVYGENVITI